MAKKDNNTNKINTKRINELNNASDELLKKLASDTYKNPNDNFSAIDRMELDIDNVLGIDFVENKGKNGQDLGSFLIQSLQNSGEGKYNYKIDNPELMIEDLFNSKNSSIFEVFNERFRNKSLLFKDLEIISDQLVELTEALNTTRDDILCADNLGAEISRSLNFSTDTSQREKYDDLIEDVKRIEKEYKLNHKIREHIVLKTLKYGEYYVYVIPKSKLFEKAQYNRNSKVKSLSLESYEVDLLCETVRIKNDEKNLQYINEQISEQFNISNDEIPLPLIENSNTMSALLDVK